MLSREKFIQFSLESNLFYLRIMKEHLFFIETSLSPVEIEMKKIAKVLKQSIEELMLEILPLANECISKRVLESSELVTRYTFDAEQITKNFTGKKINMEITEKELELLSDNNCDYSEWLESYLINFNGRAVNLTKEALSFKKQIAKASLECKFYISLYPEFLEHIVQETEAYLGILKYLEDKKLPIKTLCEELNFWNHMMAEHAGFIDGLLDPSEEDFKIMAEKFVLNYERLVKECTKSHKRDILNNSFKLTTYIQDFKTATVKGLLECEIKSIMLPLLADHMLRETNHYLRLLKENC